MTNSSMQSSTKPARLDFLQLLFNPFRYVAGGKALLWGVIIILLAGAIGSFSNSHFDGVLDTHTGRSTPFWYFLSEGIIDWLSLSVVLFVFGLIISKSSFRFIDLFGTQALARWPTLITATICLLPGYQQVTANIAWARFGIGSEVLVTSPAAHLQFGFVLISMLLLLVWMVSLMYQGFKITCNLKGAKLVSFFIIGIIIAEVISKVALSIIMTRVL